MEDQLNNVFKKEEKQILYKQILPDTECDEINSYLECNDLYKTHIGTSLVTGHRVFIDINLKELPYAFISDRLLATLSNYCDLEIDPNARLYSHVYGGIKPHTDKSRDGFSTHTLLIYLTDNFDDGKLSIKTKRSVEEKLEYENNKHHKVFTFVPKKGYGILFDKNLLHWASEVYTGSKNFLLISLNCRF